MREVCGNCKHNKRTFDGHCNAEFSCDNEESDEYVVPTMYDDSCDMWEGRRVTNADYIRSKLTDSQLTEMLDKGNCRTCKVRKLCKEKYPDGVWASFDCKRLIKKWLNMEVEI